MLKTQYLKIALLELSILIASLSCQSAAQTTRMSGAAGRSLTINKLQFPQEWLEQTPYGLRPFDGIEDLEVRQVQNGKASEFLFAALPNGAFDYAYELNPNIPEPKYSENFFAVDFDDGMKVRTVSKAEWSTGARLYTKPRMVVPLRGDLTSGEIKYRGKTFPKVGKYWGTGWLSPHGKWLAVFSYSGELPPKDFMQFITGRSPRTGDIFWQIYDADSGEKVFDWEVRNINNPASLGSHVVWLDERRLLLPMDPIAQTYNVVALPEFAPKKNPITVRLPARTDANGLKVAPAQSHEVWIPLAPLTKQQIAEKTAPVLPEVLEVRSLDQPGSRELLIEIREWTPGEKRPLNRRDGGGEYYHRVMGTYYFALSLDNPTQTRFASKDEWERGKGLRKSHHDVSLDETEPTTWGDRPKYHPVEKSGATWANPKALAADDWLAVCSYTRQGSAARGEFFMDIYEARIGAKMSSGSAAFEGSVNELVKQGVWIEGDYLLIPLNPSLDSFMFWTLPGFNQ
jgi:hypothetical protein